jgi:antitoxin component YwqK of YwqJK toxin-antitoxin module
METETMQKMKLFCLVALMAVLGCWGGDSEDAGQIERIEWLKSCQDDSECGDRECVCNLCTVKCDDDASCREEDESTVCSRRGSKIYRALCQCRDAELAGVCLPVCDDDVSCREGLSCLDGACLPEGVSLEQDESDWFDPFMMMMPGSPEPEDACKVESLNSDGTCTGTEYRSFDADGNVLVYAWESSTGEARIETSTYDEEGRELVNTFDEYGDCAIDRTYTNEYDVFGNLTGYSRDDDGDSLVDYNETTTYDEKCNILVMESDDGDGVINMRNTLSYDDEGNLLSIESLFFEDGAIASRNTETYDDEGNPVLVETDEGDDGVIDYRSSYTYEDDGRSVTYETYDEGASMVIFRESSAYDDDGRPLRQEYDEDGGGFVYIRYSSTYDDDGNQLRDEEDTDGDGVVDYRSVSTYGEGGKIEARDYYEDGELTGRRVYSYDDEGRLLKSERFTPDGALESARVYTYECNEEEIIECSPDRAVEVPTYDAV